MQNSKAVAPFEGLPAVVGAGILLVPRADPLALIWTELGLLRVSWRLGDCQGLPQAQVPRWASEPLVAYFAGEAVNPAELPVDLRGSRFQLAVYVALRQIPRGAVRSYAGIAADVANPRAPRAVGTANARNPLPIVVPCHRVVQAGHLLGGFSGGLDRKRQLLALEGIRVTGERVEPGQLSLLQGHL